MEKTKRLLSMFLCLVMVIILLPLVSAPAAALKVGEWEITTDANDNACITGYEGYDTTVDIPSNLGGYTVTSIGNAVFKNYTTLYEASVPATVTSIGNEVFSGCTSMTKVTLPEGLKTIGDRAFFECVSLTDVAIPSTVTSIGEYAFKDCAMTGIVIPKGVKSVGYYAFGGCSNLANVTISYGVEIIGMNAFYGCSSLSSLVLPSGIQKIAPNAFIYCSNLKSITLPSTLVTVGNGAFQSSSNLKTVYFAGAKPDADAISISGNNAPLNNATWVYQAPTLSGEVQSGKNVLSWTEQTGATRYNVYRREYTGGSWSSWEAKGKNITALSWTDSSVTPGTQYEYKLRACVGGAFGPYSNVVALTGGGVAILSGNAVAGKNMLSWTKVTGATKYMMYRREKTGTTWSSWTIKTKSLTGLSWEDSSVAAGTQYEYKLRACVGGVFGGYSNVVGLTAKAPLTLLTGEAQPGKNVLSWTVVSGATKYMMYRREKTGTTWGSWTIKSKSIIGTTWTDTNVTGGVEYEYKLRACVGGVFGDYSNVVGLTGLADLTLSTLYGEAMYQSNELAWTAVPGATKYMMYRREKTGATWSSWTVQTKSLTRPQWSDKNVTEGTQYEYKLRACVDGVFGSYSNVVSLTSPVYDDDWMWAPIVPDRVELTTPWITSYFVNDPIDWEVILIEGTEPLQCRFWLLQNGSIIADSGYSTSKIFSYMSSQECGPLTVRAFIKDSLGQVVSVSSAANQAVFVNGA